MSILKMRQYLMHLWKTRKPS